MRKRQTICRPEARRIAVLPAKKGGASMPQRLDPNTIDTITIVLSSLSDSLENQLKKYFTTTFGNNEHLFLQADSLFINGARGAADKIENLVDEAMLSGEITRLNPMRTNLVLYATLDSETADRIQRLRDMVSALGKRVGVSINTYACILKQQRNGEEYAGYMDRCVEICAGREATADGASRLPIPILMINRGIGIAIDLPLKATVRYLHVISRSSILKTVLAGNTELVMSISMMEYDGKGLEEFQKQIEELEDKLNIKESTRKQMFDEVQSYIKDSFQELTKDWQMQSSQFPIRMDAIGNFCSSIFSKDRLIKALNDVADSFARTYDKNVHERIRINSQGQQLAIQIKTTQTDPAQTEKSKDIYEKLIEKLPVHYIRDRMIQDLKEYLKKLPSKYEAYIPELHVCRDEKNLRVQLGEQYQKSLDASFRYWEYVVTEKLKEQIEGYIKSEKLNQREAEINEKILCLREQARAVGNVQSVKDFLMMMLTYLQTQGGVVFVNRTSCDSIMLLSQHIDDEWEQYSDCIPNTPVFNVYNYGALEKQKLQVLQIMRFDAECFRKNRSLMFQIGED